MANRDDCNKCKFDSVTLWVQIWGAQFDMVYPQVATEVGSHLGMVVEVELRRRQDMEWLDPEWIGNKYPILNLNDKSYEDESN